MGDGTLEKSTNSTRKTTCNYRGGGVGWGGDDKDWFASVIICGRGVLIEALKGPM